MQIDATPFRQWYEQHYRATLGKGSKVVRDAPSRRLEPSSTYPLVVQEDKDAKKSKKALAKFAERAKTKEVDVKLVEQFSAGRLYACIASRPGQSGRCDGYVLEGKELVRCARGPSGG